MRQLTQASQRAIEEIAGRHGFSVDAARSMLDAVIAGNGRMAQFNHPEFGGSGQWMSGGMTMVSNLFDDRLRTRVAELCRDLSELAAREPALFDGGSDSGSFQSQSQGVQRRRQRGDAAIEASDADTQPGPATTSRSRRWWPDELDSPGSSGSQNDMRYAFFPKQRRLAIEAGGKLTVYDTQDHEINGVSQQQSADRSATFTSQHGTVDLNSLRVVPSASQGGGPAEPLPQGQQSTQQQNQQQPRATDVPAHDVYEAIEKLAGLKAKGLLNDEEFAAKKAELLSRI